MGRFMTCFNTTCDFVFVHFIVAISFMSVLRAIIKFSHIPAHPQRRLYSQMVFLIYMTDYTKSHTTWRPTSHMYELWIYVCTTTYMLCAKHFTNIITMLLGNDGSTAFQMYIFLSFLPFFWRTILMKT